MTVKLSPNTNIESLKPGKYGRYGYRMVTRLPNNAGWHVNHKRVERIWRREGLKVPQKQNVLDALADLFILRGPPEYIRSELPMIAPRVRATIGGGSEFIAQKVRDWIAAVGA